MRKILIGNWKMNPRSAALAAKIISGIKKGAGKARAELVLCPPAPFIYIVSGKLKRGAQDVSIEKSDGAFTGEISASQLRSLGVSYAIVGHSERRARGETSHVVAKKAFAALFAGISPIICIGEKERHHDGEHWALISKELRESLYGISRAQAKRCVVAYEPIWAVGKKSKGAMKPSEIGESAIFIKKILSEIFGAKIGRKIRVIYGGSVDWKNAGDVARASGISGILVGRDSLIPTHFAKIAEALK